MEHIYAILRNSKSSGHHSEIHFFFVHILTNLKAKGIVSLKSQRRTARTLITHSAVVQGLFSGSGLSNCRQRVSGETLVRNTVTPDCRQCPDWCHGGSGTRNKGSPQDWRPVQKFLAQKLSLTFQGRKGDGARTRGRRSAVSAGTAPGRPSPSCLRPVLRPRRGSGRGGSEGLSAQPADASTQSLTSAVGSTSRSSLLSRRAQALF